MGSSSPPTLLSWLPHPFPIFPLLSPSEMSETVRDNVPTAEQYTDHNVREKFITKV